MSWHAASDPAKPEEILARVQGHDILINKEMPLSGALIHALPPSVRLICEVRHGRTLTLTLTPTLSRTLTRTRALALTLALTLTLTFARRARASTTLTSARPPPG